MISRFHIGFSVFLMLFSSMAFSQDNSDKIKKVSNEIVIQLKMGNALNLSEYFLPSIDLAVGDKDDVYSKPQAEQILKQFFAQHKPVSFITEHTGSSKLFDHYTIGNLSTRNGDFRITFFIKNMAEKYYIKQIRIEENDDDF